MTQKHPNSARIEKLPKGTYAGEWTKEKIEYVLMEMVEENQLACRAIYSLLDIEITNQVPTLAVTLSEKPTLKINMEFCNQHVLCENDMKCVIMHEFLHVLLGHTTKIEKNTPLTNIAMDAVINAIIHRKYGPDYSDFFSHFYQRTHYYPLLQPYLHLNDMWFTDDDTPELRAELQVEALHKKIYEGAYSSEDVLEILEYYAPWLMQLEKEVILIGNHEDQIGGESEKEISEENKSILDNIITSMGGLEKFFVFESKNNLIQQSPERAEVSSRILKWKRSVYPILMRCFNHEEKRKTLKYGFESAIPMLSASDRRATSKFLYSGLLPISTHITSHTMPDQSSTVYLDVSGSMDNEISAMTSLILQLRQHITIPLWSFSNDVYPAKLIKNAIQFNSTGGTSLSCVFNHMRKNKVASAVIITDGHVEDITPSMLEKINLRDLHVIVTSAGTCSPFKRKNIQHYQLPKLEK